jgi:putative phosphoesterase
MVKRLLYFLITIPSCELGSDELKVLVISDSHGKATLLKQIVKREATSHVIHCGDFCTERRMLPSVPITVVRGNCDFAEVADEQEVTLQGYRFYVTHGHKQQVKTNLLPLSLRAQELGMDIVCFGHSHYPVCEQEGKRLYINPGSIARARGYPVPTYAIVELQVKRQVKVKYFQVDGRLVMDRGGSYQL